MSAATVNISNKLPSGVLVAVGGSDYNDFYTNLLTLYGGDESAADAVVDAMRSAITPLSAGSAPPAAPQQHTQTTQQAPPAQQGGGQLFCPTHQRPVKSIPKKDGSGTLHKCVVNDTFVSKFGEPGLKDRCPDSKG